MFVSGASFMRAIVLHACGFNMRRASWPKGQAVIGQFPTLRVPRGHLAVMVPDWDPSFADMEAQDWETAGRWKADPEDVIDAADILEEATCET